MKILKYGNRGVQVALYSHASPGPDTVFWSPQRYHDDGQPAGGFNSFVIVEDPRGEWRAAGGERVALVSVNGIGEIRWPVSAHRYDATRDENALAIAHFGIVPFEVRQ